MATLVLRWRFFWSRRTRWRIQAFLVLFAFGVLAAVYLVLPASVQAPVAAAMATGTGMWGTLNARQILGGTAAVAGVLGAVMIFGPSYRRHTYLATEPSLIPPVSVYLDAENQVPAAAVHPFTRFLIKHLDGRRADLLYFLDASQAANSPKYRLLYRVGFRPVDVPHNPTGAGTVKEAVDRELAMHAYERALRGPAGQEFILVTGDGDYVPLIYRLAALGHRVQVWGTPMHRAYAELATYLNGVNALDLALVLSELQVFAVDPPVDNAAPLPATRPNRAPRPFRTRRRRRLAPTAHIGPPVGLSDPREEQVYQAIAETRAAHARCQGPSVSDQARNNIFRGILGSELAPRLASIGYGSGNWIDCWLDHLVALGALQRARARAFPADGPTTSEDAARALYAAFNAAAEATARIIPNDDGTISMSAVARLLSIEPPHGELPAPLRQMLAANDARATVHARYFVRGARALGLIRFVDTQRSLDIIRLNAQSRDGVPRESNSGTAGGEEQTRVSGATESNE